AIGSDHKSGATPTRIDMVNVEFAGRPRQQRRSGLCRRRAPSEERSSSKGKTTESEFPPAHHQNKNRMEIWARRAFVPSGSPPEAVPTPTPATGLITPARA